MKYGRIAETAHARRLVETVIEDVLAVARASRVSLPGLEDEKTAMAHAMKTATQMADALSSAAQGLNRGKPTEIYSLNGFITRRGLELAVPTPINHALFTLVKLLEMDSCTVPVHLRTTVCAAPPSALVSGVNYFLPR